VDVYSVGREPGTRHDGTLSCSICATSCANDTHWCSITNALICPDCCRAVRAFEPSRTIEALSRLDVALLPEELVRVCASCPEGDTPHGPQPTAGDESLAS
jgi:hypothetical protein